VRSRATVALASVGGQFFRDEKPGGRSIGRVGHTAAVDLQNPYSGTQQRINCLHVATPPATLSQHLQPDEARKKILPSQFQGGQEHPPLRSCQPTRSTSQYLSCVVDNGDGIRRRQGPVTARWRPIWPSASELDCRSPDPEPISSPHRARGLAPPHGVGCSVGKGTMPRSAAICLSLPQGRPEISSRRVLATAKSPGTAVATSTATTAPASASAADTERNRGGRRGNNLGPSGRCHGPALGRFRGLNGSRGLFSRTGCFGGHGLRLPSGPCHLATLVARHFAGHGPE